jgi:hypothetical protein
VRKGAYVGSLLPYLDASSGILEVSLVAQDPPTLEAVSFPFVILSESDPLTLLIHARFRTDAGSELAPAFLLVQRDAYPFAPSGVRPISNPDVERAWQGAYHSYLRAKSALPPVVFAGQLTEGGRAARLSPLFYCKKTATFFHPPCPRCSRPLDLCEDDALLQKAGLQPYTGSLKRYLYCAACGASDAGAFYVKERESTDPPGVSDREGLIGAFGGCREGIHPATRFPCPACPHHAECYEPGNRAPTRIAALSFYPFHLLTFPAMSVCGEDFLALLSGATLHELAAALRAKGQQGRLRLLRALGEHGAPGARFLFERDERWFLEVLFLKLSFLGEVLEALVRESDILRHPEIAPSMERLWVKMPAQCGLLPWLWNFRVQLIDIASRTPGTLLVPEVPGSFGLHCLGLLWLEALLSNRRQGSAQVHEALRRTVEACPLEAERLVDRNLSGERNPAFLPENIFWEPEGKVVDGAWSTLWGKALRLGWTLLAASSRRGPEWSAEAFRAGVESIRMEVRDALFPKSLAVVREAAAAQQGAAGEPSQPLRAYTAEAEAIHGILQRMQATWRGAAGPQGKEPSEELEKTRILSPAAVKQPPDAAGAAEETEEEVFVETVLLTPGGAPGRATSALASAASSTREPEGTAQAPADGEELEKTIILDAAKLRGKGKDGSRG